jgi:hypothetical protein
MRFRLIEDHRDVWPVRVMCDALSVSASGYYAWRSRPQSPRAIANRELLIDIRRVHAQHRERYGAPRIRAERRAEGQTVPRKRVERVMRQHGGLADEALHDQPVEQAKGVFDRDAEQLGERGGRQQRRGRQQVDGGDATIDPVPRQGGAQGWALATLIEPGMDGTRRPAGSRRSRTPSTSAPRCQGSIAWPSAAA